VRQIPGFFVRQIPGFFVRQIPGFVRQIPGFVRQIPGFVRRIPGFVRRIPGFVRRIPGLSRWVFSRWGFMLSDSPGGSLCCRMLPAGSFVVGFLRLFADGPVDPVCVKNSGKHPEKRMLPVRLSE